MDSAKRFSVYIMVAALVLLLAAALILRASPARAEDT